MGRYSILAADPERFSEGEAVIRRSFATVASQFGLTRENAPSNPAFLPDGALSTDAAAGKEMYFLYDKDKIIGFIQLVVISNSVVDLSKLCVLPEYRSRGGGRQLLDFAKARAKAMGRSKLTVGIIEKNTALKSWYVKNGFIPTGARIYEDLPFLVGFLECRLSEKPSLF